MGFHTEKIPGSIKGKEIPGTFLFCLYLEYFSRASLKVRSAVTHLQPNLYYHPLSGKIKTKNSKNRSVNLGNKFLSFHLNQKRTVFAFKPLLSKMVQIKTQMQIIILQH